MADHPGSHISDRVKNRKVKKVMGEFKRGTLRSGSGAKVTGHEQAIAIGLSEARKNKS